MTEEKQSKSRTKGVADAAKQQGGGIGIAASTILTWVASTYLGVTPPPEVVAAGAGLVSGIGGWVQRNVMGD